MDKGDQAENSSQEQSFQSDKFGSNQRGGCRKGTGYTIQSISWLLDHYEFKEGQSCPSEVILGSARRDGVKLNKTSAGRIISDVWGNKVVKVANKSSYKNLSLKEVCNDNLTVSLNLDMIDVVKLAEYIQEFTQYLPAWSVEVSESKVLLSKKLHEVLIEEQRVELEIELSSFPVNIVIRAHGNCVPISELGLWQTERIHLDTVLQVLEVSPICIGFPVEQNLTMCDSNGGHQSKITTACKCGVISTQMISTKCSVLARSLDGTCSNCSYVNKLYHAKVQRMVENPNPFCNNRYLDFNALKEKASTKHKELKNAKTREERVRGKLADAVEFCQEDDEDMCKIFERCRAEDVPDGMKVLWQEQVKQLSAKSEKGNRWNASIIRLCLHLYCKNPRVLDQLRKFIVLPSNRLIRYYKNAIPQESGWNVEVAEWCKAEADRQGLQEGDRWGCFIIDEMKIQEDLQMTVRDGVHRLVGIVSTGQIFNDMDTILKGKPGINIASQLLQFIFLGDGGFRFPVAHFATNTCHPSILYFKFWEGVLLMKRFGFSVYYLISDGGDPNRQLIKMHFTGCDPCQIDFQGFNIYNGDPMFFLMDCKHNFKKLRNNVEKSYPTGSARCLTFNGKLMLWSHWKAAYNWDQTSTSSHIHERLTEEHFDLTPSSRMRNHLAEDVLDKKMLFLMQAYKEHLLRSGHDSSRLDFTLEFLMHTSHLVELFNDKHFIYSVQDKRLVDMQKCLHFFKKWESQCQENKNFISAKLWFDLQSLIQGFAAMVSHKLSRFPEAIIRPAIVNQDACENHFSQLRGANAQNENPTYLLAQGTQNAVIFGQSIISRKSNTGVEQNETESHLPVGNIFKRKNNSI